MKYRNLTDAEIYQLKEQGNSAGDWSRVLVAEKFTPSHIFQAHFSGDIQLGVMNGEDDRNEKAGIYHARIHNCSVGSGVYIQEAGLLSNYTIGDGVIIERVSEISMTGESTFANGYTLDVLNEGGGRELPICDRLSSQLAYLIVLYGHDPLLSAKLKELIKAYSETKRASKGTIEPGAVIRNSRTIRNVHVGAHSKIDGCELLKEGTLRSCAEDPVKIGEGVIAKNFIILDGSHVESAALLDKVFVGQGVRMGKQFSAENSVFFANAEGFHGEAVSLFAGPYAVTHHKSTLLIAALVSFYNAGSGTNQSNHMYKQGPVHQGVMERGGTTGSFGYLLWPCKVGAYSVVMGKHGSNFDSSEFPFSYITVEEEKSFLTPGMNILTVGTRRDIEKWPNRDRRKTPDKTDLIHFDWLNPWLIQKVNRAIDLLNDLYEKTPKEQEAVNYKGLRIKRLLLKSCKKYYEMLQPVYLGDEVIRRIAQQKQEDAGTFLKKTNTAESGLDEKWLDTGGMYIKQSDLDTVAGAVKSGQIGSLDEFLNSLKELFLQYELKSWSYVLGMVSARFGKPWKDFEKADLFRLITEWKENKIRLNNMILSDAKKEFDPSSRIGFGADGGEAERDRDFEVVRGRYETNKFVNSLMEENRKIEQEAVVLLEWVNR